MDHPSWDWEARYSWCTGEIMQLDIFLRQSGVFWAETVLTLRSNVQVRFSLALQQTQQIQSHRQLFMILKSSSLIRWCSCLPRRPNCWVSSHHSVWVKDSGVLPPSFSLFQKISSSSSDSCRALFGRLSRPAKRSRFASPSSTCLEELNSLCREQWIGYTSLFFKCLSSDAIITFQAFWFVILTVFVSKFGIESLEQTVKLRRLVIFNQVR